MERRPRPARTRRSPVPPFPAFALAALLALGACGGGAAPGDVPPADVPDAAADLPDPGGPDAPPDALPDAPAEVADLPGDPSPEAADTPDAGDPGFDAGPFPAPSERPFLLARPADRERLAARLDRPLFAGLLQALRDRAATDCEDDTNAEWTPSVHERNGIRAQANAVLAWLLEDADAADKARECFRKIRPDLETSTELDVNIRVANGQIPFVVAWDLMAGTGRFPQAEAAEARDRLLRLNEAFFDRYVNEDFYRWTALVVTRNNHPIRTASSMGFTALAFPDAPRSVGILDFAASELDDLFGPDGMYIQADGVVSEEPFYFGFGLPPALAFFAAMRHAAPPDRWYLRNCIARNGADPWGAVDCVDGQPFRWQDPLAPPGANAHADRLWGAFDWSLDHRMPSGLRSPTGDGGMRRQNGALLAAALSGRGRYAWDGRRTPEGTVDFTRGLDLLAVHLLALPDDPVDVEPWWTTALRPDSGHAVLRSGWGPDDLWMAVLGESGPARKTIHDHVDGTTFSLAAYGESLIIDTGYYKPDPMDNAKTAHAGSHNVILIDGKGAPDKGYLNDFGDVDAAMPRGLSGARLDLVEVEQPVQGTTVQRTVALVRDRYALVADALSAPAGAVAREHAWRVHGWAGHGTGESFEVAPDGATFVRERAGVRVALASTAGEPAWREPPYTPLKAPHVHEIDGDEGEADHGVADGVVTAPAPGFLAVLAPWRQGAAAGERDGPLLVARLASGEGTAAFSVTHADGTDVAWLRDDGAPDTLSFGVHVLRTDARLLVLGLDDGLLALSRGTFAELDGKRLPLEGTRATDADPAEGVQVSDPPFDACGMPFRDDDACFAARRDPGSDDVALALAIARRQMARVPARNLSWDWVPAVMMTAFADLHRVTGDPDLLAYLRAWVDTHLERGYDFLTSDTASPVAVAMYLHRVTGDARYGAVVDEFLRYVREECLRTPEGGLNHMGVSDVLGVTLWVDSLWMVGVPLARLGTVAADLGPGAPTPLDEAQRQFRVFRDRMQQEPGFLYHAVDWALPQDPGVYWGRGNGWVMGATAEYLRQVRAAGRWDDGAQAMLQRLAAAARAWQDPGTGLWWTVLNRPGDTYLETSVAALFAFGMARGWRLGVLGDEVLPSVRAALDGVRSRIRTDPDGPVVTGTSGPTTAGTFVQYAAVKVSDDVQYGIGAVVLALLEASGLPPEP